MELVDANTKNYVFLTLSQFNDKQRLVRTRVSMRRDQPFWDGGNSYICCESFRVTSSPNQGGLYYKVFPYNWYMGCDLAHGDPNENPADDQDYQPITVPAREGHYPWDAAKSCYAGDMIARLQGDTAIMEGNFYIQGGLPTAGTDFPSNDPTVVRAYLNKFCNEHALTKGTWVQLTSQDDGHDGLHSATAWGRLSFPPSTRMTGNGLGPSTMYYPDFEMTTATQASVKALIPELIQRPAAAGLKIPMNLQMKPIPGQSVLTGEEVEIVTKELGKGLFIQARTRYSLAGAPEWNAPMGGGAMFQVMGIQGVAYKFQNRFFQAGNTDTQIGTHDTAPKRQMKYASLTPGAVCWIDIKDDEDFEDGRYYGSIVSVPQLESGQFPLHTEALAQFKAYVATLSEDQIDHLLQQRFMLTTTIDALPNAICAPFEMVVQQSDNCGPIEDLPDEDSAWQFGQADVEMAVYPNQDMLSCIRRPGSEGDRYIYTPNEMFLEFNKEEPNIGKLPYSLQTDENGGFVIHWDDTLSRPSTTFRISIALSEELGLLGYFQYDVERYSGHTSRDEFQVLKQATQPWLVDDKFTTWLPRSELSTSNTEWVPAPPVEPNVSYTTGEAPLLYDRDGNAYYYVSTHMSTSDMYENSVARIYPTVEADEYGELFYEYHDLPTKGKITNTQQVSVESFSTYSEITLVIPNLPFQSMLGTSSDERILASLRLPFINGTGNDYSGAVTNTTFGYYGDLIFNTLASRSYLKITTDQQLYDCDVEVRLIRRDGQMDVMQLPYKGEFQVKLRLLQTQ